MKAEVLRMERVSCIEQGVVQLDGFHLNILSGEIVGLLPVNNHGLTALLRLLQYNTPLRYGYVYYLEEQVNTWRNSKQRNNRIGLIQSESCLVDGLTVADNIFVLRRGFQTWFLKPSVLRKQLLPFLERIDVYISADAYVDELTAFEKVVVDVLKSVVAGYRLIVLREISVNLSEAELTKIVRLIQHYARQGISFLYIDFHFEELVKVCDKIALMSNGRIVKTFGGGDVTREEFQTYMKAYGGAGTEFSAPAVSPNGMPAFDTENLKGRWTKTRFSVFPGECVVVQSAETAAFAELLFDACGKNRDCAVIQELPTKTMLFTEMSYIDNLCFLMDRHIPEVWRSTAVREGVRREYETVLGDVFDKRVDALSKVQKYELVYTRVALGRPKTVFCVQPFRRADMELRAHISRLIKMLLDRKIAVVILTANAADCSVLTNRVIKLE